MSNTYAGDVEIDLGTVFRLVFRKLPLLILFGIAAAAGVYYLLSSADPVYRAETTLLIETGETDLTRNTDAATTAALLDQQGVASQVQLIRSRDVAIAVIEQLGLEANPDFDPALKEPGLVDRLMGMVGLGDDGPAAPVEEVVLADFMSRLSVNPITDTRVIAIAFEAGDPRSKCGFDWDRRSLRGPSLPPPCSRRRPGRRTNARRRRNCSPGSPPTRRPPRRWCRCGSGRWPTRGSESMPA